MDKICGREGCGCVIEGSPSYVKKRKYCSQACNAMVNFGKVGKNGYVVPTATGLEVSSSHLAPDLPPELIRIRREIKIHKKCIAYDECNVPIGEYDWDGNLKEYV